MKILMVTEFFPVGKNLKYTGGVETREFFVAKYLSQKNQVTVLTSNLGGPQKESFGKVTILKAGKKRPYRAVTGSLKERLLFIKEAVKIGSQVDAEIIDGSNFITHFIAAEIAKKKKIPSVAWYPEVWRGEWVKHTGPVGITGEILERVNLKRDFDAYIAISNETAKKLKQFTNKKIYKIYCGVDPNEFKGKTKKFTRPTIITIGRLSLNKNQKTIIEALSYLKDVDCNLIIVGTGPREKKLKDLINKLGLNSRAKFYENIPRKKLVDLLKSSHVFVSASKLEGFGISIIEGAIAGLPYVVSDISVHKEVTKNGQGGFLVNSDNPKKFAEKIKLLIHNKKLYEKKSRDAENLSKNYDWEKIAIETEEVYQKLV